MPSVQTLTAFVLVSLGVMVIPGQSSFFILTQGASHGRRQGLAAMAGIETASAIRVLATAAGLSAVLASCPIAFQALRWAGVAYLAYLGMRALRTHAAATGAPDPAPDNPSTRRTIRKGIVVGLSNAKMAIFFLAFFPQFIHADHGSHVEQILILGAIFWVIGAFWDLGFAWASASIGAWMRNRPRAQAARPRAEAVTYLALAAWTALSSA